MFLILLTIPKVSDIGIPVSFTLLHLTPTFVLIITTSTRSCYLTTNMNMGLNKLLSQSNYMVWLAQFPLWHKDGPIRVWWSKVTLTSQNRRRVHALIMTTLSYQIKWWTDDILYPNGQKSNSCFECKNTFHTTIQRHSVEIETVFHIDSDTDNNLGHPPWNCGDCRDLLCSWF